MAQRGPTPGTAPPLRGGWARRGVHRVLRTPGFWFVLVLMAVPVLFAQDRIGPTLRALSMDWQGAIRVEAELTGIVTADAAGRPLCRYDFRFVTPEGVGMTGSDRRAGSASECRRPPLRFAVQYPPGAPQEARIDHRSLDGWVRFLALLVVVWLVGLAGLAALWWREARLARVLDRGVPAQGRVTQIVKVRNRGVVALYLDWEDPEGRQGRSRYPLGARPLPKPGDTIELVIDPRTGRSHWRDEL